MKGQRPEARGWVRLLARPRKAVAVAPENRSVAMAPGVLSIPNRPGLFPSENDAFRSHFRKKIGNSVSNSTLFSGIV